MDPYAYLKRSADQVATLPTISFSSEQSAPQSAYLTALRSISIEGTQDEEDLPTQTTAHILDHTSERETIISCNDATGFMRKCSPGTAWRALEGDWNFELVRAQEHHRRALVVEHFKLIVRKVMAQGCFDQGGGDRFRTLLHVSNLVLSRKKMTDLAEKRRRRQYLTRLFRYCVRRLILSRKQSQGEGQATDPWGNFFSLAFSMRKRTRSGRRNSLFLPNYQLKDDSNKPQGMGSPHSESEMLRLSAPSTPSSQSRDPFARMLHGSSFEESDSSPLPSTPKQEGVESPILEFRKLKLSELEKEQSDFQSFWEKHTSPSGNPPLERPFSRQFHSTYDIVRNFHPTEHQRRRSEDGGDLLGAEREGGVMESSMGSCDSAFDPHDDLTHPASPHPLFRDQLPSSRSLLSSGEQEKSEESEREGEGRVEKVEEARYKVRLRKERTGEETIEIIHRTTKKVRPSELGSIVERLCRPLDRRVHSKAVKELLREERANYRKSKPLPEREVRRIVERLATSEERQPDSYQSPASFQSSLRRYERSRSPMRRVPRKTVDNSGASGKNFPNVHLPKIPRGRRSLVASHANLFFP